MKLFDLTFIVVTIVMSVAAATVFFYPTATYALQFTHYTTVNVHTLNGDTDFVVKGNIDTSGIRKTVTLSTTSGLATTTFEDSASYAISAAPGAIVLPQNNEWRLYFYHCQDDSIAGSFSAGDEVIQGSCDFYFSRPEYLQIVKKSGGQDGKFDFLISPNSYFYTGGNFNSYSTANCPTNFFRFPNQNSFLYTICFLSGTGSNNDNLQFNIPILYGVSNFISITTSGGTGQSTLLPMGYPTQTFNLNWPSSWPLSLFNRPPGLFDAVGGSTNVVTEIKNFETNALQFDGLSCDHESTTEDSTVGLSTANKIFITHNTFSPNNIITCTFTSTPYPASTPDESQGYLIINDTVLDSKPFISSYSNFSNSREVSLSNTNIGQSFTFNVGIGNNPTPSIVNVTASHVLSPGTYTLGTASSGGNVLRIDPGEDYTVTQSESDGWQLIGVDCNDDTSVRVTDGAANVTVLSGLSEKPTVCTFYNVRTQTQGQTGLRFIVNATGGDNMFGLTASGSVNNYTANITTHNGNGKSDLLAIEPDTYNIKEQIPLGFSFTSASCDDGTATMTNTQEGLQNVTIDPGKITTCTFTNTKNTGVTITNSTGGGGGGNGGGGGGSAPAPQNSLRKPSDQPAF